MSERSTLEIRFAQKSLKFSIKPGNIHYHKTLQREIMLNCTVSEIIIIIIIIIIVIIIMMMMMIMDPLSYFSFHPVLHDWCNKGHVCAILTVGWCI